MSRRSSVVSRPRPVVAAEPVFTATQPLAGASFHVLPLLLLFAGSGCSALIYEIVWFQLLQLVIGSSAISLGLLLAAYMGGLAIGSIALPRLLTTPRGAR